MESNFRTFTITQARMGQPLQFQPALGSKELDELVDAYVPGTASKSDKLSTVTLEFFTNATVDFATGSLTRTYSVLVSPTFNNYNAFSFETSPTQSQSSGFSPSIYTPSPASSMTFADSGFGSVSMTPPTRTQGVAAGRVVKKVKKDTKKAAEARLPGFSIMTKDGVDVTSSAGRGTKTKEQREHAHLMRIMKACDACKRKKVRCDPSHRRPATDMSRSATANTVSSSSSSLSSSSSRPNRPSQPQIQPTSFGNNAIEDFVLFPEGDSWNADLPMPEFDANMDLTEFNFDIGINNFAPLSNNPDQFFDYSSFEQQPAAGFQVDQWQSPQGDGVTHTRPHPSISPQDSSQLGNSWLDGGVPLNGPAQLLTPQASSSLPEIDWSLLESSIIATPPAGDVAATSSMNRRQRRDLPRAERAHNAALHELIDRIPSAQGNAQAFSPFERLDSISGSSSTSQAFSPFERNSFSDGSLSSNSPADGYVHSQSQSPGAANGGSQELWGVENARSLVAESMQSLKSSGAAYQPIVEELEQLQGVLASVKSGDTDRQDVVQQTLVSETEMLSSHLQALLTRVENMPHGIRSSRQRYNKLDSEECRKDIQEATLQTRQLVSSLCATINSLQTQQTATGAIATINASVLATSNVQLAVSRPTRPQAHPQDAGARVLQSGYSSLIEGSPSYFQDQAPSHALILDDGQIVTRDENANLDNVAIAANIANRSRILATRTPAIERLSTSVQTLSDQTQSDSEPSLLVSGRLQTPSPSILARPSSGSSEPLSVPVTATPDNVPPHVPLDRFQVRGSQGGTTLVSRTVLVGRARANVLLAQNVEGLRSDSSSSPGSIPGTVLHHVTNANADANANAMEFANANAIANGKGAADGFATFLAALASLALLSFFGATSIMLPLAALFLAVPRLTLAKVGLITMVVLVAQAPPMTIVQTLLGLVLLSTPSYTSAKASVERVMSSHGTSSSLSLSKNTSLRSMFDHLSVASAVMSVR